MPPIYTTDNESYFENFFQTNYSISAQSKITLSSSKRLSGGAIFGIVVGVLAFVILLSIALYYLYKNCKTDIPDPPAPLPLATPAVGFRKSEAERDDQPRYYGSSGISMDRPKPVSSSTHCMKPFCIEYLKQLNLNNAYFARRFNKCFCKACHVTSNVHGKCGNWCMQLHDWMRFGLCVNRAHQQQCNIFSTWKNSYYGTSPNLLAAILANRFLPFDGDKLIDGSEFKSGHPDRTQCTTSPSLQCASQSKFCTRSHFRASNGTQYTVQVVLLCKQQPQSYTIKSNSTTFNQTEWGTKTRSTIIPYGLLVRLS